MIKAVFIDIDNTLLSFSGYVKQAMKEGFEKYGLPAYNDSMYLTFEEINNGIWKDIEKGKLSISDLRRVRWGRIFKALGIDFNGKVFEDYFRSSLFNSAIPEPGAYELLEYLSDRYVLCAASNGPYEQQINRLKVADMHKYFKHFFISEKIGTQKPGRKFFNYCFKELRKTELPELLPEEAIMIGDSVSADIEGGKAYGMVTCLYRSMENRPGDTAQDRPVNAAQKKAAEEASAADYTVSTLTEIKRFL